MIPLIGLSGPEFLTAAAIRKLHFTQFPIRPLEQPERGPHLLRIQVCREEAQRADHDFALATPAIDQNFNPTVTP